MDGLKEKYYVQTGPRAWLLMIPDVRNLPQGRRRFRLQATGDFGIDYDLAFYPRGEKNKKEGMILEVHPWTNDNRSTEMSLNVTVTHVNDVTVKKKSIFVNKICRIKKLLGKRTVDTLVSGKLMLNIKVTLTQRLHSGGHQLMVVNSPNRVQDPVQDPEGLPDRVQPNQGNQPPLTPQTPDPPEQRDHPENAPAPDAQVPDYAGQQQNPLGAQHHHQKALDAPQGEHNPGNAFPPGPQAQHQRPGDPPADRNHNDPNGGDRSFGGGRQTGEVHYHLHLHNHHYHYHDDHHHHYHDDHHHHNYNYHYHYHNNNDNNDNNNQRPQ